MELYMIKNISDISKIQIKKIRNCYLESRYSVDKIAELYHLERNVILVILNDLISINDLPNGYIKQDKFIAIADTHLGSIYEKMLYLDFVYNYATDNNIYDVLHAGDVIQSTIEPTIDEYNNDISQLNHLVNDYPNNGNICTHILFGNHDYNTLKKNSDYIEIIKNRKDFNLLGFKRAYLSWQNYLITVAHDIKKYKVSIPNEEGLLRFVGHRHSLLFSEPNNIYLPTLSLEQKRYIDDIYSYPGFLVCEMQDTKVVIIYYAFKDSIINHYDKKGIIKMRESNFEVECKGEVISRRLSKNMLIR